MLYASLSSGTIWEGEVTKVPSHAGLQRVIGQV